MLRRWATEAGQFGYTSIPPLAEEAAELLEGLYWAPTYLKESLNRLVTALDVLERAQEVETLAALAGDLDALRIGILAGSEPSPIQGKCPSSIKTVGNLPHELISTN